MAGLNGDSSGSTVKLSNESSKSLAIGEDPSSTISNLQEGEGGGGDIDHKELPGYLRSVLANFRRGGAPHMRGVSSNWVDYDDLMGKFSETCIDYEGFFSEIDKLNSISEVRQRSLHALGNLNGLWSFPFKKKAYEILTVNERADLIKQLSVNPALEICGIWLGPNMTNDIAKVIANAPNLLSVIFHAVDDLSAHEVNVLAEALVRGATSLEYLDIQLHRTTDISGWRKRKGWLELLRSVFTGIDCNRSIKKLHLTMEADELGEFLPQLLTLKRSPKHIRFVYGCDLSLTRSRGRWREIGLALQSNTTLQSLAVTVESSKEKFECQFEGLKDLFSWKNTRVPFIDIRCDMSNRYVSENDMSFWIENLQNYFSIRSITFSCATWRNQLNPYETLECGCNITCRTALGPFGWPALCISGPFFSDRDNSPLCEYHTVSSSRTSCRNPIIIESSRYSEDKPSIEDSSILRLRRSLRFNTNISSIKLLVNSEGSTDLYPSGTVVKTLMGLLQVNSTLRSIDWGLQASERASVDRALARNAKLESYFAVLKGANLKFNSPRVGRLFLCGSPHGGKTQLRKTMMRVVRDQLEWRKKMKDAWLWRTKGIEIELLKNDDEMQIAIWDMAGHHIFRALQDLLFPQAPQPSIFLFVFSPFDRVKEKKQIKLDPELSLRKELREWLMFIISNSQMMGSSLPQVLVVVTHRDLMKSNVHKPEWASRTMNDLREEFHDVIELLPELNAGPFYLDATSRKHVSPVLDQVLDIFKTQFQERFQAVPEVCMELSSVLARDHLAIPNFPICELADFHTFCLAKVDSLKDLGAKKDSKLSDVLNAITSYLHDVGSIVRIPDSRLVVVSPNWLSQTFLGELITGGHNFQAQPYDHVNADRSPTPNTAQFSGSGFVSECVLEQILQPIVDKEMRSKRNSVTMKSLKSLLVQLELSFKVDDGSGPVKTQYFIPHIVRKGKTDADLRPSWSSAPTDKHHYLGFRLQCRDPRTSLTSAFFARLQITLRRKLKDAANVDVTCSRGYVQFIIDGHEIIVEQRQRHEIVQNHVDILVKGSENKAPDVARQFVMIKVINEIITFCSSSKGCPGVVLILGILRTACVENLTPFEHRGEKQAILIDHLRQQFENDVESLLQQSHNLQPPYEESLLKYEHSWPSEDQCELRAGSELASDLLGRIDVVDMLRRIHTRRGQILEDAEKILVQVDREASAEPEWQVPSGLSSTLSNVEIQASHATPGSVSCSDPSFLQVGKALERLENKLDKVQSGVEEVKQIVLGIKVQLGHIIDIQNKLQTTVASIMSNVDRIVGFSASLAEASTPRRPYFTKDDVTTLHKATATLLFGTPVRLHFMCESTTGNHIVKGQDGFELSVTKANKEWLTRISVISLKILAYSLKAGLQMTVGLGQVVPELGDLQASRPLGIANFIAKNFQSDEKLTRTQMNEAWSCMRDKLEPQLQGNYCELFRMHKVKYRNLETGGYAWVCWECMMTGIQNNTLVSI